MKRLYAIIILAGSAALSASAQGSLLHACIYTDSLRRSYKAFCFHYRLNSAVPDTAFADNAASLRLLRECLERCGAPDTVYIRSTASPDGPADNNARLAAERGTALVRMLSETFPALRGTAYVTEQVAEDWRMLGLIVRGNADCPEREEVLSLLSGGGLTDEDRKAALKGRARFHSWLQDRHAWRARSASMAFRVPRPAPPDRIAPLRDTPRHEAPFTPAAPAPPARRRIVLAPRTNLLLPLLNVGVEVPVGDRWSAGTDYCYPWWLAKSNRYCCEMLALSADCRWWFAGKALPGTAGNTLCGHAAGVFCSGGYYDFQWDTAGRQGEFAAFGIDYTLSLPLADGRLRLQLNAGLGVILNWHRRYSPDRRYELLMKDMEFGDRFTAFFGPARAAVSLSIPVTARAR